MKFLAYISLLICIFSGCTSGGDYSPKPRGYFRIVLPEKQYQNYSSECNFSFDYPVYSKVYPDSSRDAQPCFLNVVFPQFNGRIHLTYKGINTKNQLDSLTERTREYVFKHTVKATGIEEGIISYPDKKVYGTFYTIRGNTASSLQFVLTDSTKNYLRGALYFFEEPRQDSIRPVVDFLEKDMHVMIKSLRWK